MASNGPQGYGIRQSAAIVLQLTEAVAESLLKYLNVFVAQVA